MSEPETPAAPARPDIALSDIPLAERVRPRSFDELVGQQELLGPGKPLRLALERGHLRSMILWGPPGVGKTTIARLLADALDAAFVGLSAVTAGVKQIRTVAQEAVARQATEGRRTILFLDEVHRFSKSQQDVLLPFLEDGTLTLIGATTENPSFEVNPALRSRSRLLVLEPLGEDELQLLLRRALTHPDGLAGRIEAEDEALALLASAAGGDARRALDRLELAAAAASSTLTVDDVRRALGPRAAAFDKGGEHFYNLISALHKAIRGSDPDAGLYWLARLLAGGADLGYLARRLVRIASEDVGLADPGALRLAVAARDAALFLGQPEGELALAEAVVYLAVAPKSNAVYRAWGRAREAAARHPEADVPLHLRNAPTGLMKRLGYGRDYAYYFDDPVGSAAQRYLPERVREDAYYRPGADGQGPEGWEAKVANRLEQLRAARQAARAASESEEEPGS